MKISIAGLNKVDVLLALYRNAVPLYSSNEEYLNLQSSTKNNFHTPAFSEDRQLAIKLIKKCELENNYDLDHVDLGDGSRSLRINLANLEFDPAYYDNQYGLGSAKRVIDKLRKTLINDYDHSIKDIALLISQCSSVFVKQENEKHSSLTQHDQITKNYFDYN